MCMKLEALRDERLADFIDYCKRHKSEVDESYLYDADLKDFKADEENPTYILTNEQNQIVAVASILLDDYSHRGKKARFRIFHSEIEKQECFDLLLQAILKHTEGLNNVYIFVPFVNTKLAELIQGVNFQVERHSFLLVRSKEDVPEHSLPEGYEIRSCKLGQDEATWCEVRNASFATLKGSETPVTPDMISKMLVGEDHLEGGEMILYHDGKAVGVVRGAKDEYEDKPIMNIGPLAILPDYQGRGLGRILLRASLKFAKENGYESTILCVNGENERAKALYIQEGFEEVEGVTCYKYLLQ